jgi:hypothetical protein
MITGKKFRYEITDDDSIIVDFDNDPVHKAKYQIVLSSSDDEKGDQVVLSLNKKACKVFAKLFAQLGENNYENGYHFHLSLTEEQKNNEGLRIVLDQDGRFKKG